MLNPCLYCRWQEDCKELDTYTNDYCEEFVPIDDDASDTYLSDIIEERRASFREEWFSYVEYHNS